MLRITKVLRASIFVLPAKISGKRSIILLVIQHVGTVEGYTCTKNAYELAHRLGVEMPITEQLYAVLFEGLDPKMTIAALMQRPKKNETEKDFLGECK